MRSLKVKCNSRNCPWVDELGLLEGHLETCEHVLVPCSNGCESNIRRSTLQFHLTKRCPLRQHICGFCKKGGTYKDMKGVHLLECPDKMIPCPNDGCKVKVLRKDMNDHHSLCPKKTISCPYINAGCTFRSLREQMDDHVASTIHLHLGLAMKEIGKLKKCNVFKVSHFKQLKESQKSWYSRGFYTHTNGYRICLVVVANGFHSGSGTHMSVYLLLLKGEHDDNLIWPLRYKCTITLLNQLKDEDHYTVNFECVKDTDACSRVVIEKQKSILHMPKFIAHDKLGFHGESQYLMDDCLCIKVEIEVLAACKPWLTATVY